MDANEKVWSVELRRFLFDHAGPESWASFAAGIGIEPTSKSLAAAMKAAGYQIAEEEVVALLESNPQSELTTEQLDTISGGSVTSVVQSQAQQFQTGYLAEAISQMTSNTQKP